MRMVKRAAQAIAPGMMAKRERARTEIARQQAVQRVFNQGYGNHGASTGRKSLKTFLPGAGDAQKDIEKNLPLLRSRARDLYMGGALPNGALKAMRTNVVGTGLRLKPAFDAEHLGLSPEAATDLARQIEREWSLWAESKECDALGLHNFYELQQLAFLSQLMSGDTFPLLADLPREHAVYDLRIKIIEADRCNTPAIGVNGVSEEQRKRISSGVETDKDGMVVAYWFSDRHPQSPIDIQPMKWTRVPIRGEKSGRRNVLHMMDAERPEQRRGVPILAPVIEAFKQLERYIDAELTAAVIAGMFTVFVKMADEDTTPDAFALPDEEDNPYGEPLPRGDDEIGLGNGAVNFLRPGEEIQIADPKRPFGGFDPFVMAVLRQVGAALELPYELLLKNFTSSYSASRGALLEAWKMFRMRRTWMAADFCQPIYEEWFAEAAIKGRINVPGLFDDPQIFRAYTRAEWHGPSYGMLDPVKEVNAAILRMQYGLSNGQREAAEMTGTEYESNIRQLAAEQRMRDAHGLAKPEPLILDRGNEDPEDDSDDED
ncbi:phage portal protein [Saccharibacillus sp. O16]|nr:phage portal protein [Saccharibacillus sp. O16]